MDVFIDVLVSLCEAVVYLKLSWLAAFVVVTPVLWVIYGF